MFYKDDWLSWTYDGVKFGKKTSPQSKFEFEFKKVINRPIKTHKEELLANTRLLRDKFSEPFDLLFSGGVDSEVILRCHHELKIPINVFIFKYKNDYNYQDVRHALRICDELNVTPTVIDFNLNDFFEKEAYDIWKKVYTIHTGMLTHMKMVDYLDNIPVMGSGVPTWVCVDGQWKYELQEFLHGQSLYANTIGRKMIHTWYSYSPEVLLSHCELPRIQKLFSNPTTDPFLFETIKYYAYKDIWPEIVVRPKRNGYEQFGTKPKRKSDELVAMIDFENNIIRPANVKSVIVQYTKEELINLIG